MVDDTYYALHLQRQMTNVVYIVCSEFRWNSDTFRCRRENETNDTSLLTLQGREGGAEDSTEGYE